MTNWKKGIASALMGIALVATCALTTACGGTSAGDATTGDAAASDMKLVSDGKLTVAFSNGFPPMEFSEDGSNNVTGFDIDLIKAVAEDMGLKAKILPTQKFDTLVPTIKAGGKADVCISAVTINDERKKEIAFSDPYLDSNQAILAGKNSTASSLDDFNKKGVTVVCSAGTTGEAWAKENLPNATVLPLDDYVSCFTGTTAGNYDACVADLPVASYLVKNSYKDLKICAEVPTGEQYGIVMAKDNTALQTAVNKSLANLEENGKMDELKQKWFGTTDL